MPAVMSSLPKNRPAMPILYSEAQEQLELVRRLEKPSLIAVVSVSQFFLDMARGVLSPFVGRRHSMREYLLTGPGPHELGASPKTISGPSPKRG